MTATADARSDSGAALADAFNRANQQILTDVVAWTVETIPPAAP